MSVNAIRNKIVAFMYHGLKNRIGRVLTFSFCRVQHAKLYDLTPKYIHFPIR